jgi:plastocyanin
MMIRRAALRVALAGVLLMLLSASSVSAATRQVEVFNFGFNSNNLTVAMGDSVRWHNGSTSTHTSTANQFGMWNMTLARGATSAPILLQRGGSFGYRCTIHSSMTGKIAVRIRATPTTGSTATNFVIRVGLANAPSGYTEDIQMRRSGGTFATWRSTTAQTTSFRATSRGTYQFRSRLRHLSDGVATAYGPVLSVTVN